jgi:hypothetical protein
MLSTFIKIRESLTNVVSARGEIIGLIQPDASNIRDLSELIRDGSVDPLVMRNGKSFSIDQIEPDQIIEVKLFPSQINGGEYFESEKEFLVSHSQLTPSLPYYIFSLQYQSSVSDETLFTSGHKHVVKFINFLKTISSHSVDHDIYWEFIFFQSKELVFTTEYDVDDAKKFSDPKWLIEHVLNSVDHDARKAIIINEMTAILTKIEDRNVRFRRLLSMYEDILSLYKKSFQLYIEKYSFEKLKTEVDKEVVESKKRIAAVLNDAQSKLVAIPAASLIVIGQFDLTGDKQFPNIILLISALVFGCLIDILIRHQLSTLEFINRDVQRFRQKFDREKILSIKNDFDDMLNELTSAFNTQKRSIRFIRCLAWFPFATTVALFIYSEWSSISSFFK